MQIRHDECPVCGAPVTVKGRTTHYYEPIYLDTINKLEKEISILRLYGNKDCTAQADEVLKTLVNI